MSDFWFGVFAALAVWKLLDVLATMAFYGKTLKLDRSTLFSSVALFLIFLFLATLVSWGVL